MEKMYSRNRIYIKPDEQEKIKHFRVLLGGAGIGSIIAECALRMGFETITIIDGDKVEKSNLNRQNYRLEDVGNYKAESLAKRLLSINPQAKITVINKFVDHDNVEGLIEGHDVPSMPWISRATFRLSLTRFVQKRIFMSFTLTILAGQVF